MATLEQIATGLAQVLCSAACPSPLPVDLSNHMPAEASHLVKLVIRECAAEGRPLSQVRLAPKMAAEMQSLTIGEPYVQDGVPVVLDNMLGRRVEFYAAGGS